MSLPTAITKNQFDQLLLQGRPMIDLRAPIEFAKGAFPTSVSLPLMSDRERELIGTCYKQQGQDVAINLGHELIKGKLKQARVDAWVEQKQSQPNSILYCFRGGLRSRISQQWLADAGFPTAIVEGGYKALRQHCMSRTDELVKQLPAWVLSGRTGTGKTRVLAHFPRYVDLEGLAHHRGSSFGKHFDAQPSQIDFESALTVRLLELNQHNQRAVAYEDESRLIGRCMLPQSLQDKLKQSPILVLEDELEARVERILTEYVVIAMAEREQRLGSKQQAFEHLSQGLQKSLSKIRKRLGDEDHRQAQGLLANGLQQQSLTDNFDAHKDWIRFLLNRYYDPMYDYLLSLKQDRIVVKGSVSVIQDWLLQHTG